MRNKDVALVDKGALLERKFDHLSRDCGVMVAVFQATTVPRPICVTLTVCGSTTVVWTGTAGAGLGIGGRACWFGSGPGEPQGKGCHSGSKQKSDPMDRPQPGLRATMYAHRMIRSYGLRKS